MLIFRICAALILTLLIVSCGNSSDEDTLILDSNEETPPSPKSLPTKKLGLFTIEEGKPKGLDSQAELIFKLNPDNDFLLAYEMFATKILRNGRVLGAYESAITVPYRERIFGGDKKGTNSLHVFEFVLIRRQIASCVSIEPGFLLYREGDHIEGASSLEKIPDLITEVSIFTDVNLYKQVHEKDLSQLRWRELLRQLAAEKDLKFLGIIELEIKYCQNKNNPKKLGEKFIKNAILRLLRRQP